MPPANRRRSSPAGRRAVRRSSFPRVRRPPRGRRRGAGSSGRCRHRASGPGPRLIGAQSLRLDVELFVQQRRAGAGREVPSPVGRCRRRRTRSRARARRPAPPPHPVMPRTSRARSWPRMASAASRTRSAERSVCPCRARRSASGRRLGRQDASAGRSQPRGEMRSGERQQVGDGADRCAARGCPGVRELEHVRAPGGAGDRVRRSDRRPCCAGSPARPMCTSRPCRPVDTARARAGRRRAMPVTTSRRRPATIIPPLE